MIEADICVIGAGSGGLSVAAGAAQMGAKVVLVEKYKMGGDCLNYGCIPSKALLAAAKKAHVFKESSLFGVSYTKPKVDFAKVHDHICEVIKTIEPHDSVERFESLGVTVIKGAGKFTGRNTVQVGKHTVRAKKFVISTGSKALIPPIPGIKNVPHLTNENIFGIKELPKELIVIGGGPIGCEMAQAFARLGSKVTVVEAFSIFPKDDRECVEVVRKNLIADGIDIREGIKVNQIEKTKTGITIHIEELGHERKITGTHLLVAAGRKPNVDGLELEVAGIEYTPRGIVVDNRLRTTNKCVFAIGDVAGGYQFTHVAGYHAGVIIRNILFKLPARVDYRAVPWVTYTDPELAHVGMMHEVAHGKVPGAKTLTFSFANIDRAVAERHDQGMIKVTTDGSGKILGATIVGQNAGELLAPWIMAIQEGKKIVAFTNSIMPYPTLSEINKKVAGSYYTPMLFSDRTKKIVRFLMRFS